MMREQFLWAEKYRPKTIAECILPIDLRQTFEQMIAQKDIPNLLLVGPAGPGKTTVARCMLEQLGCNYLFIPASMRGNIDTLRNEIANFASSVSFNGKRKYVILDEADYLTHTTQPALRNFMEEFARNCGFVLTANFLNKIIPPLQSRCSTIEFVFRNEDKPTLAMAFYKRLMEILNAENVQADKKTVVAVVQKFFPDFRRILNECQRYSAGGKLDSGILTDFKKVSVAELLGFMKGKDFTNVRKWVGENLNNDSQSIFREFYESSKDLFASPFIPELVLILAKYQYQSSFVVDQEINLAACLVEVMMGAIWK